MECTWLHPKEHVTELELDCHSQLPPTGRHTHTSSPLRPFPARASARSRNLHQMKYGVLAWRRLASFWWLHFGRKREPLWIFPLDSSVTLEPHRSLTKVSTQ